MMLSWTAVLLLLQQADAQLSVITAQLGEPVSFTCSYPDVTYSNTRVKWYKQSVGDTLALITTLVKTTEQPAFQLGFRDSRFDVNRTADTSTLTILRTVPSDEAVYHCEVTTWSQDRWSGTYLSLEGNHQRTTVVQAAAPAGSVRPGDAVTLECSVLSDSETSCSGEHSVHWFGVPSGKSHPNIIHTGGSVRHTCDRTPDAPPPPRRCVYRFSKSISASDAGTHYCAVAACGEIIFGNGTKLDVEEEEHFLISQITMLPVELQLIIFSTACGCIVGAILIYFIRKCCCSKENVANRNFKRDEDKRIYSAAVFAVRDVKALDGKRIYAFVKSLGLN